MKLRTVRSAGAALCVLLLAAAGFGWDDAGHKLSARLSWEVMTPVARERAVKILLAAPEDSDLSVLYNSFGGRPKDAIQLELFMHASTWPDVVRSRNFPVRYGKYHKSNWHYGAIFWGEDGKAIKDFPEPSGIAVEKLKDFETILRSGDSSDAEKAVALAWFLHVAGDLHNPLHNASRVTSSEPKGDQGGNLFYLEPAKEDGSWRLNLHSFWDSQITRNIPREGAACDTDYLESIAKTELSLNPPALFKDRLKLGDYAAWNLEGYGYLPEKVYGGGLTRDRLPDALYNAKAFRLSLEQLALAGYRIGETLNSIFDPNS
ncbi:MAG TPA: S1/P1 nuclease [Aridibacter sp.]|nr:S1/P1 nuclease [Aridibacter sp.]